MPGGAADSAAGPLQVAIVGSGPSGFYAAEALLRSGVEVRVDLFERLPTPFGLVRGGVAPDHPRIKTVIAAYDRTARAPNFGFFGNVTVGRDLSVNDLRRAYHAVIFAYGASAGKRLEVPGDGLPGSHTATEFVGWYNGHPDFAARRFDLSHPVAAIVGQGNVAADLARMLLTPCQALESTDIADHALGALRDSGIREVHLIGRRGPVQARFTAKELAELGDLTGFRAVTESADLALNAQSREELDDPHNRNAAKNMALFERFARNDPAGARRLCRFRFLESPVEIAGVERVEGLVVRRTRLEGPSFAQEATGTEDLRRIDCGLVIAGIGYRGKVLPGLPFEPRTNTLPNTRGRILLDGRQVPGLYAAGWIKRGARGLIGNNRSCSAETVHSLLMDAPALKTGPRPGGAEMQRLLEERGIRIVRYADWERIDAAERQAGAAAGKARRKFVRRADMLALLGERGSAAKREV